MVKNWIDCVRLIVIYEGDNFHYRKADALLMHIFELFETNSTTVEILVELIIAFQVLIDFMKSDA